MAMVDGDAADGDGQASGQGALAGNVPARGTFRVGAAHQHIFNLGGIDAGALHGMADGVTAQRRAVGHVERTFPTFGERGAGGGNNDGFAHDKFLGVRFT
jgi:hypothetical protein